MKAAGIQGHLIVFHELPVDVEPFGAFRRRPEETCGYRKAQSLPKDNTRRMTT